MNVPPPKDKTEIEETRSEPLPTPDKEATKEIHSTSLPTLRSDKNPATLIRRRKSTGERHNVGYGEFYFGTVKLSDPNAQATAIKVIPITPEAFAQSQAHKKKTYP